ncbi:MAG: preprotein translocase subunit Sec61beta [Promethearchaeota archaeon]
MSSKKKQSRRSRRRSHDAPMPMGGAGLIRFFQDESTGIKVGPIATVLLSVLLIVVVILGHNKVFSWFFQ